MAGTIHRANCANRLRFAILAGFLSFSLCFAVIAGQRIHIAPKFVTGESLRYQIDTRTATTGTTSSPIKNLQAATEFKQTTSLLVRLDVLSADPGAQSAAAGRIRLRATYEKSHSISESDAYDPQIDSIDERFKKIEGHALEFTIEPTGEMSDIKGLDEIFSSRADAEPIISWAKSLTAGKEFPQEGIAIGQKWSNERMLTGTPLNDLVWRGESAYLRDEACPEPGAPSGTCAVILMRFEIARHGSAHSNATPEDYRRNGLRTSGKWTGSGESLESISLSSGMLISSTQHSVQDMDYEIVSVATGSSFHHTGHVASDTEIKLVPQTAPQP
jgi:hypothetical protein